MEISKVHKNVLNRCASTLGISTAQLASIYTWAAKSIEQDVVAPDHFNVTRDVANQVVIARCLDNNTGIYVRLTGTERSDPSTCLLTISQVVACEFKYSTDGQVAIKYWQSEAGLKQKNQQLSLQQGT
jgi:hypothetical protein